MFLELMKALSRRDLFRLSGTGATAGLLKGAPPPTPADGGLAVGPTIYESLGVRPMINARGTVTVISGSQTLPDVKRAMDEASRHYVHLDELMEAVGRRLAQLTGAEWGMVTSGAAGGLTLATCAAIAGADPDKLETLPYLQENPALKSEVIIPAYSRNVYDHAIRMTGVRIVEVETMEQLESALGPKTALVMVLAAARGASQGPLALEKIAAAAGQKNVPVLVDAAAEQIVVPNPHLSRGASLVVYSGGKCLRGPQCAGLLLGRKDLVQAAWVHSAPHHSFGRSLKVGKEEIVGMLAAVEVWMKRDHVAEAKKWESWLAYIAQRVKQVEGVNAEIIQPKGLSDRTPMLRVSWDESRLAINGDEAEKALYEGTPRIAVGGAGSFLPFPPNESSSLQIVPYMLAESEVKVVADRLYEVLAHAPRSRPKREAPSVNVAGEWDVHLEFVAGSADHRMVLRQTDADLQGTYQGTAASRDAKGFVEANRILLRCSYTKHGARLNFTFTGTAAEDRMQGEVSLGEYGRARWSAKRRG